MGSEGQLFQMTPRLTRVNIAMLAAMAVLLSTLCVLPATAVPDGPPEKANAAQSENVSLGDGEYVLFSPDGRQLHLQYISRDYKMVARLEPREMTREGVIKEGNWLSHKPNVQVVEIALSRWSRRSLVALVKVCQGRDAEFWCLTFEKINAKPLGDRLSPLTVLIANGSGDDRILALSGTRDPPTIAAIIGRRSVTRPGAIDSGIIFIDGCSNPAPIGGRIGRFTPEYEANSDDLDNADRK